MIKEPRKFGSVIKLTTMQLVDSSGTVIMSKDFRKPIIVNYDEYISKVNLHADIEKSLLSDMTESHSRSTKRRCFWCNNER